MLQVRTAVEFDAPQLERDKKIAIVEYAPGAEVVADKHVWKSVGVVIRQELNSYEYRVCRTCRHLDRSPRGGIPIVGACQICGDTQPDDYPGEKFDYVDPDGFTTDWTAELRRAGLQVDLGVNRSRSFLLAEGEKAAPQSLPLAGPPLLHYSYRRDGRLVAINSGADPEGFCICERCGRQVESPRQARGKRRKAASVGHRTPWGEKCAGAGRLFHLGHHFNTDTLHLRFESTANCALPSGGELSFWRSLTYALLEGASLALQIERRDLDGVVRPVRSNSTNDPTVNYSQEIVLFDNVPGGAGHSRHLADKLETVLRRALAVVECSCAEDTSCQNCLRNYGNQFYWEELKRGPVAAYLESLLIEAFPEDLNHLAAGAARVAALEKPRWLAQQILAAEQEVWLAVKRLTRERPQGESRNWLELIQDLLRRGRKVSLCLPDLPTHDPAHPDLIGLRNHLHLLVQDYGLKLFTVDAANFPPWHVVIDHEGGNCRAIRFETADCALHERSGVDGLIYTTHPEAMKKIAAEINKLPRRVVVSSTLAPPPNVRILHIRDGELVLEANLFAEVFRLPLTALHINDRFLRSAHHEKRLRAYLTLVNVPPSQKAKVTVATLPAEIQPSRPPFYQTSTEQRQMLLRLQQSFPQLDLQLRLDERLPHDRFLELRRTDGTMARIGIGAGLDFIQSNGRARMTDLIIEDPLNKN